MSQIKSPFLIIEDALSPLQCEQIVDSVEFLALDVQKNGLPMETTKISELGTKIIHNTLKQYKGAIKDRYGSGIAAVEDSRVIWSAQSVKPHPLCDNSVRVKDKWLRIHNRDLTAVVFLVDFNDKPPFDGDFEVYGGKMEFPSHGFGFNPVRGTMVIMPSDPHFAHVLSEVFEGDLFIAKTFIQLKTPLLSNPKNFPGTWAQWLHTSF